MPIDENLELAARQSRIEQAKLREADLKQQADDRASGQTVIRIKDNEGRFHEVFIPQIDDRHRWTFRDLKRVAK